MIPWGTDPLIEKITASPTCAPPTATPTSRQRPLAANPAPRLIAPLDSPPARSKAVSELAATLELWTELDPSFALVIAPDAISAFPTELLARSFWVRELWTTSPPSADPSAISPAWTASVWIWAEPTESLARSAVWAPPAFILLMGA